MGLIESLLHRHGRLCVHSRPGRRLDFGSELPRSEHVPFLPFLPAPTVSSAEARPEDRTLDSSRVCCTPQPVLEFATFPIPGRPRGLPTPGSQVFSRSSPVARTLRSFPLSSSRPVRHRFPFLAEEFCVHRPGVPSRRHRIAPPPCRHDCGHPIRPQGFRPLKSPLHPRGVATPRSSMLPWALDRTRSVSAAAVSCAPGREPRFAVRCPGPRPASPHPRAERRQRFSAVSGSERADACIRPEGRRAPVQLLAARRLLRFWSARRLRTPCGGGATGSVEGAGPTSNESEESRHPPHRVPKERWAPMKKPEGSRRIAAARPKRFPTAGPFHPKVLGLRLPRHAPKSASRPGAPLCEQARGRAPVVRASASGQGHPKAPRPRARDSTPTSLTPPPKRKRGSSMRHPSRRPEGHRVEPARAPPERGPCAGEAAPEDAASWLRRISSKLESAGLGPDRHRLHPGAVRFRSEDQNLPATRRSSSRRSRVGSAEDPRSAPVFQGGAPSRPTEVDRAEPSRSPIRAVRAGARAALVPTTAEAGQVP